MQTSQQLLFPQGFYCLLIMYCLPAICWCFIFTKCQCPLSILDTQLLSATQFKLLFKAFRYRYGHSGLAMATFLLGTSTNNYFFLFVLLKEKCKKSLKNKYQDVLKTKGFVTNLHH